MKKTVTRTYENAGPIVFTMETSPLFCPYCGDDNVWNEVGHEHMAAEDVTYVCAHCGWDFAYFPYGVDLEIAEQLRGE